MESLSSNNQRRKVTGTLMAHLLTAARQLFPPIQLLRFSPSENIPLSIPASHRHHPRVVSLPQVTSSRCFTEYPSHRSSNVPTALESHSIFLNPISEDAGSRRSLIGLEATKSGVINLTLEVLVMTKLRRRWIVGLGGATLIVSMTAFPSFAEACHGCMMHGQTQSGHDQHEQDEGGDSGHYLKHLLKHAKEIGLTPEQIGKLKAMQLDFKRTEARLEADTKIAKLELHALLEDDQADLNAIQARVDQLKKAEGTQLVAAIKSKRNAMAMLTPEQREKERVAHEQMKGGGQHGGRGMMGSMGGGMMGGSGHGQGGGDHGSGGSGGSQQHQH